MPARRKAVLFDLDGTLLDTLEDIADATNAVLAAAGHPGHPTAAFKRFVGDGMRVLMRRALPSGAPDAEIDRCVDAMRGEYGRRWKDKTRPYPGIPELLDALEERGLPAAILSNKPDVATRMTVAGLLGRWRFAAVRGARPEGPFKPDPAGALEIARELGLEPREILYAGDSDIDVRTAAAAGMPCAAVLWGFRGADELRAAGAETMIEKPEDLLGLL